MFSPSVTLQRAPDLQTPFGILAKPCQPALDHLPDQLVSVGHVGGLDAADPYFDPHRKFQEFKTHPAVRRILDGGDALQRARVDRVHDRAEIRGLQDVGQ